MTIFNVFTLMGGIAMFLYGMEPDGESSGTDRRQ